MIVDIGGGTTEVAVISLGGVVVSHKHSRGGRRDRRADRGSTAAKRAQLLIGERTAEACKIAVGSAYAGLQEDTVHVRGRDLQSGLPRQAELTSGHIREAISAPVTEVGDNVKLAIEATPPELLADIMEHGIYLAAAGPAAKSGQAHRAGGRHSRARRGKPA